MSTFTNAVSNMRPPAAASDPKRMAAAAKAFESVMLNQWLQIAESSFGAAPGGSEDNDQGGQQTKSFATQQLADQFAAHGGIGLSRLVESGLAKANGATHKSTNVGRATP